MRSDDELLNLIRTDKRKKVNPIHISLDIDPYQMGEDHEVLADEQVNLPVAQFTMDPDSVVAQVKIAAKLDEFINHVEEFRSKYVKQLSVVYGPLMREFYEQYSKALRKKVPDLFEMRQTMAHVKTFAKEISLREDKDEAIFDAKRIDNALETIMEDTDANND